MLFSVWLVVFFFFKQKTAYEMRISDWSSDVCSSDLYDGRFEARSFTAYAYDKVQTETHMQADVAVVKDGRVVMQLEGYRSQILSHDESRPTADRKSVV